MRLSWAVVLLCVLTAGTSISRGQGIVTTIAGAFAGYVDGNNDVSQFNTPLGIALDGQGNLFIADLGNQRIRRVRLADNMVFTFATANTPTAVTVDKSRNVYVTSRDFGTVAKYDQFGNFMANIQGQLVQPTALTIDKNDVLYVAEARGTIRRFTLEGAITGNYQIPATSGPALATGLAVTADGRLIVADFNGQVLWAFTAPATTPTLFAGTPGVAGHLDGMPRTARFNGPSSLSAGINGSIVVADYNNHRVRVVSCLGVTQTLFGIDPSQWETTPHPEIFPGWADGNVQFAESRLPVGVAVGADGTVYDSEAFYHIIRKGTGLTFPAACGGTNNVVPVPILTPNQGYFPNGVTVSVVASNVTQRFSADVRLFYTLNGVEPTTNSAVIPMINGQGSLVLAGPIDLSGLKVKAFDGEGASSPTASGLATIVPTIFLSKDTGYYPMGVQIEVTTTNGFPAGTQLFYTLDGTDPTTNSLPIQITAGSGTIRIQNAATDLRLLRVRAFLGANVGAVAAGKPFVSQSSTVVGEVGIPPTANDGPILAGVGAKVVIPVVANLRAGQTLRSMQFVVEVVSNAGSPRLETAGNLRFQTNSPNDFIKVINATTNNSAVVLQNNIRDNTNRLAIAYIGTNSFAVNNFAVVGMVAVQIPPADSLNQAANEGDTYTVRITNVSGTSDGTTSVGLTTMAARTIRIQNIPFIVGDTGPGYWYNAGTFGDGRLDNSDVNNVIFASFGFNVPFADTDAFEAMDAFNIDTLTIAGGDGRIRLEDWVTILRRSVGFDNNIWARRRVSAGDFIAFLTNVTEQASFTMAAAVEPEIEMERQRVEPRWNREAIILAEEVAGLPQTAPAVIPVYLKVDGFKQVSSLQFVARVESTLNGPGVSGVTFVPAGTLPPPMVNGNAVPGQGNLPDAVYVGWNEINPSLSGTVLLGTVRFSIPAAGLTGDHYTVRFENHQGLFIAAGGQITPYNFESIRGGGWVNSAAIPQNRFPDEWQTNYFGMLNHPNAAPQLDPDDDGFSNQEEFIGGSNPNKKDARFSKSAQGQFIFRFPTDAGFYYTIERSVDLKTWTAVATRVPGKNSLEQYTETLTGVQSHFYRVKEEQ